MAEKFVDYTGLSYFYGRLKRVFANLEDFNTLKDRVDNIISSGGEPNRIDIIAVNGTNLTPDANKKVNITVPTKTSDLTNDGNGTSNFATEAYVNQNGGKIDTISVNGTAQTITNKNVNLTVPTKLSDLTNDGNFVTDASYVHTDTNYTSGDKGKVDKLLFDGNVIDSSILPGYIDDVIEAYPVSGATELSSGWLSATSGGAALTPEAGKIYVLMADTTHYSANSQFRYGGSTYVKLSDGNISAITTAEIDTIIDGE